MSLRDSLDTGRLANLDAVAAVNESVISAGGGAGMRAIDVAVWDGISVRIYPDRGLDLGPAWYCGVPLAWTSGGGEARPLTQLDGMQWSAAFMGGLLTTCGLRNVGMPSEGHGLHGTYSHLPAHDVGVERQVTDEGGFVEVTGDVVDTAAPGPLLHRRTIRIQAGAGRLEVIDTTQNLGAEPAETPILYHLNFGYPLWAPPAHLDVPAVATTARDAASEAALQSWHRPPPLAVAAEQVLEHDLGAATEGKATITNLALDLVVSVTWDRGSLPRLNQWLDPNPGMSVLGIEPANCGMRGRAFEREAGTLAVLDPGEQRTSTLVVTARSISSPADD